MAADRRADHRAEDPTEIAHALNRQARVIGVAAMVLGGVTIAVSAWLLFATEEVSLEMLFCFSTLGLLSLLAGYQKLRAGHDQRG